MTLPAWLDNLPETVAPGILISLDAPEWQFQRRVCEYAQQEGWLYHHVLPSKRRGMIATQQLGQNGFPDLVMLRDGRCVVAELKAEKGTVSAEQRAWLAAFEAAGCEVYIWKPRDKEQIEAVLRKRQ